jgi:hypothetical protein
VSDLVFGAPTGDAVTITSAGSEIPVMKDKEFFEVRNNSNTQNNGLYQVDDAAPAANTTDVRKVSGADPVVEAVSENNDILCSLDTAVSDGDWNNAAGSTVDIISAGANLPTSLEIGSRFEVRTHATSANNGGYEVLSAVTDGFNCQKLTGADPADAAAEPVDIYSEVKSIFYDTAALGFYILEEPGIVITAVSDAVWGTPAGALVNISSAANELPDAKIGQKVLVTDHITAANNGYYVIRGITTLNADWDAEMVSDGLTPAGAAAEALNIQTDALVDDTGVLGQPLYSRTMIDWKDDNFLIDNADFPMFNVDSDAGKYLLGQDATGNNSGWIFIDNAEFGIRSRKLVRNMGWQEINSAGLVTAEYAAIRSNATVEDNDRDLGYFQFGTDTTVDDTVDFEFAGPVDESIKVFDATVTREQLTPNGFAFAGAGNTITRVGGSYIADGYKVGGRSTVSSAEDPANDGTRVIIALTALIMTVQELDGSTTSFTVNADDNSAVIDLDNRFAFSLKLRPRDDDALGKTFAQQGLGNALATQLSNRAFIFGLGTVEDANITVTDVTITGTSPWQDMTLTFHATPQTRGAATLVGGARDFGIIGDAATGGSQEFYEFAQWALRQLTDIDNDADTNIGRTIDGLLRFNGAVLEVGSVDGGLSFPTNPDSGDQDGMYVDNLAAADANNIKYFDSLNVLRSNKETIAVTLDFNEILIDDTIAEGTLYFDRTVRTTVGDLVINAGGTFTSGGGNLPVLDAGDGSYVRVTGQAGADEDANGIYQVVTETSTSSWTVVRYDNAAMITTTVGSFPVDEHPFNAPDSLVVNTTNLIDDTTISFTAPDTISDSGSGLGIFAIGDSVRIDGAGAGANAGLIGKILTAAAGVLTIEQGQFDPTLVNQGAGGQVILTEVARVDADADFSFNFGFDDNVQGGRPISQETFVKAKALGRETAQYTASAVLSIISQTPLTVPLQSQQERNVVL